jgi:hypothetical protein
MEKWNNSLNFFGMYKFWQSLNSNKKTIVILVGVMLIGFTFRAYNFSEWLRFNMDQSRDINVVENSIDSRSWPLLGPRAGGTDFRLGAVFYDFQIISAKIFGATPTAVAYPDLLFSLLSIPLFFLLAKIYFNKPIALSLTWLFAISYFVIKYSRFAWNPNSTPFFVMLFIYSVYRINNTSEESRKKYWAIATGLGIGIGVQLHTTLLIIMPIIALIFAYYLFKNKILTKAIASMVLISALVVNVPQILSEIETGGLNMAAFILSVTSKNSRNTNIGDNLILNASCHIRANYGILTSYSNEEECGYNDIIRDVNKLDSKKVPLSDKITLVAYLIIATIFSIGGYYLMFRRFKKETDDDRKFFSKLIISYIILTFLFFIVWATELSMRFFLILEFVPFLLLGLWLDFIWEKTGKRWLIIGIIVLISFFNLQKSYSVFRDLQFGGREINNDFEYITFGEARFITNFIKNNNAGEKGAYLDAQAGYLFKSFRSLQFTAQKSEIELIELNADIKLERGVKLFYLKNANGNCQLEERIARKYEIEKCALYRQFSIFDLKVK